MPYTRGLGGFWDDVMKVGDTIQKVGTVAGEVQKGNARVTVIPTGQGVSNYAQSYLQQPNVMPMLLLGGGLLAAFLFMRNR